MSPPLKLLFALAWGVLFSRVAVAGDLVAVSYLDSSGVSKDFESLGRTLSDLLISDLDQARGVRSVQRTTLESARRTLKLERSEHLSNEQLLGLAKELGASHVVAGTLVQQGEVFELQARLFSATAGENLVVIQAKVTRDDWYALEKTMLSEVLRGLGLQPERAELQRLLEPATTSLLSGVAYGVALDAVDAKNFDRAKDALTAAVVEDRNFVQARNLMLEIRGVHTTLNSSAGIEMTSRYEEAEKALVECVEMKACDRLAEFAGSPPGDDNLSAERNLRIQFFRKVHDADIPTGARIETDRYVGATVQELALVWLNRSCTVAEDWACALEYGRELLEKYPTSTYASPIRMNMEFLEEQAASKAK